MNERTMNESDCFLHFVTVHLHLLKTKLQKVISYHQFEVTWCSLRFQSLVYMKGKQLKYMSFFFLTTSHSPFSPICWIKESVRDQNTANLSSEVHEKLPRHHPD